MHQISSKNLRNLFIVLLIACILTPSFTYAARPAKPTHDLEDAWFNDFKFAIEARSSIIPILSSKSYVPLNGGICVGYYFFKYKHTELGEFKSTGRSTTVETGEGKVSIEVGMHIPEQHRYGKDEGFQLTEKFIAFPIALRWTIPDFHYGNRWCVVVGGGYIPKYLISSRYTVIDASNKHLPYANNIDDLKTELSGLKSFAHDFFLEGSWQFAIGLYIGAAFVLPLKPGLPSLFNKTLNSEYVHDLRRDPFNDILAVTIGLDIVSLYKYIHEDDYL